MNEIIDLIVFPLIVFLIASIFVNILLFFFGFFCIVAILVTSVHV